MKQLHIDYQALLDPNRFNATLEPMIQLLIPPEEMASSVALLCGFLLRAQLTGPNEALEFAKDLKKVGDALVNQKATGNARGLGATLKALAKVSENAGHKLSSTVIKKDNGDVIVTTN